MNIECAVLRATELVSTPNIRPNPSGPGVMDKFYEHVMRESEVISAILANDRDMTALTDIQQRDYQDETECAECGGTFTKSNHKVRHHDHVTGQYLFCLLYTSPSPRDRTRSRMPSSA